MVEASYTALEVKDVLYQAISEYREQRIVSDIVHGESPITISTIYNHCIAQLAKSAGNESEIHASFAESLIHYMLSTALIPSQRKTLFDSVEIDIAVPDTKTLASSPQDALVIAFPKTSKLDVIKAQVNKLKKIQPNSHNIWLVLDKHIPINAKVYALDKERFTFANIINDLISFSTSKKQSKLKIFKI